MDAAETAAHYHPHGPHLPKNMRQPIRQFLLINHMYRVVGSDMRTFVLNSAVKLTRILISILQSYPLLVSPEM